MTQRYTLCVQEKEKREGEKNLPIKKFLSLMLHRDSA